MSADSPARLLFMDQSGELGGAELSLLDIASHFRDRAAVLLFADGPFRTRLAEADLPVEVLPADPAVVGVTRSGGAAAQLRAAPGVARLVRAVLRRSRPFDMLYANTQKAFVVAALAGLWTGKQVVWHLRDMLTADHFSPAQIRLAHTLARLARARVIANSHATAEAFVTTGGRPAAVQVIHNGIDPRPFLTPPEPSAETLRRALGLGYAPVVGLFSRPAPWKGHHVLLDAAAAVPDIHVLLVGAPLFQEDHRYEDDLRRQVARLDLAERVHFLGFRTDIPALLRTCDIVVHTSTAPEPFGRVIVEGMLAERPVVAARAGGACEIIEDGETGYLVEPGNAEALARRLALLLDRPDHARRLAEAGHASALARFTLLRMLTDIEQALRALHPPASPVFQPNLQPLLPAAFRSQVAWSDEKR